MRGFGATSAQNNIPQSPHRCQPKHRLPHLHTGPHHQNSSGPPTSTSYTINLHQQPTPSTSLLCDISCVAHTSFTLHTPPAHINGLLHATIRTNLRSQTSTPTCTHPRTETSSHKATLSGAFSPILTPASAQNVTTATSSTAVEVSSPTIHSAPCAWSAPASRSPTNSPVPVGRAVAHGWATAVHSSVTPF